MKIIQLRLFDGKRCTMCHQWLPLSDFYKKSKARDGLEFRCKKCLNAVNKAGYYAHHEERKRANLQYHQDHRDQRLARFREYRQGNGDKLREVSRNYYRENKQRMNQNAREWRRNHRDDCRRLWHAYRARRKAAEGTHARAEWMALRDWFGNRCLCCGTTGQLTIDHVVPLSKGGRNDVQNLQPLCLSCNCSKQDKIADYRDPVLLAAFLAQLAS